MAEVLFMLVVAFGSLAIGVFGSYKLFGSDVTKITTTYLIFGNIISSLLVKNLHLDSGVVTVITVGLVWLASGYHLQSFKSAAKSLGAIMAIQYGIIFSLLGILSLINN